MQSRYIVLDQNVLRKLDIAKAISNESNVKFVLPDSSLLEMTKKKEWEDTLKNSFQHLAQIPEKVFASYSINEALRRELERLKPVNGYMLHREATKFVRGILSWVRTGEVTFPIQQIRNDTDGHLSALAIDHLNHEENKKNLVRIIEATKEIISEDFKNNLRRLKVEDDERLDLIHERAKYVTTMVLLNQGHGDNAIRSFLKKKPLLFRYFFVKIWYSVEWISKGGIESFPGEKVTNEVIDHQYVLTASFFHDFMSHDVKAMHAYHALRSILANKV